MVLCTSPLDRCDGVSLCVSPPVFPLPIKKVPVTIAVLPPNAAGFQIAQCKYYGKNALVGSHGASWMSDGNHGAR